MTAHTPSRLLARLDADIAAATDPVVADCLRAERAAYLARQGQLAEAGEAIEAIRRRHAARPNVAISAWLSLAEGLLIHFTDMGPLARDRVQRAYALSTAADLRPIRAISAAWMAHLEYARLNAQELGKFCRLALDLIQSKDTQAISRVCLVIGQSLHYAGMYGYAQNWYRRVRDVATLSGDEMTLTALTHNMAWLHMSDLRNSVLNGANARDLPVLAHTSADSSVRLAGMFGDRSLLELIPTLRAQLLSLAGQCVEAIDIHERSRTGRRNQSLIRFEANLLADLAWCYARSNDYSKAIEVVSEALASIADTTQIDEVAATYTYAHLVYSVSGDRNEADRLGVLAAEAWRSFEDLRKSILDQLVDLKLPIVN